MISIVSVLFFSIDGATFQIIKNADSSLLMLSVLLVVVVWCLDSFKFVCLSKVAGENLSFRKTLSVVWINYFGCAITPMQSGGGPFQIYLLYKNGVAVGKSVAITFVRTLQILFILGIIVPFAFITEREFIEQHFLLRVFVCYVGIFLFLIVSLLVISFTRPHWIKRWTSWFLIKFQKFGIIKPRKLLCAVRWVNKEVDNYSINIRLFVSSGKKWFFISFIVAIAHLLVYMSIMPCLILAMGFEVEFMQCLLAESLFLFFLYFVPTPGASGAAEGGATAIFALFVPWNLAGVMAIAWRVISEYSGVLLGTLITIKLFGWGHVEEVLCEERAKLVDDKSKENRTNSL